jgi:hypothetical protein
MHWDGTVTAGNLLTAVSMIAAVFIAYTRLREQLVSIQTKLEPVWAEFIERRTVARRAEDRE